MARHEQIFELWCALTGHAPDWFEEPERQALLARTEIALLAEASDAVLLNAGQAVCRGGSLPLERWLAQCLSPISATSGR